MTSTLRRAGGFAVVGTLALAAPVLGRAAAAPFALIAVLAAFVVDEGPVFELFATSQDRQDGRLNALAGFSLAATGLALLATIPRESMSVSVFVTAVLVLSYGNLGARAVERREAAPFRSAAAFSFAAFFAAIVGQVAVAVTTAAPLAVPRVTFLAAVAALVGALFRAALYDRDDPLVLFSVGLLLWLLDSLPLTVNATEVGVALGVTLAAGAAAYVTGTASVTGLITGVLLGLLTIVLGGLGWFAVLISFFAVGGLSTKFRYEDKLDRGVAEENEGARGSSNVFGNAAVAMVAVVGFAASPWLPVHRTAFEFAFAGSIATAMSDTLSSEVGGLYDAPRLVTTLERVPPGTDGGVTWQGELAGVAGAGLVAVLAVYLPSTFRVVAPPEGSLVAAAALVLAGGVAGMTADSLLGATVEGDRIGNQAVNFLATLVGATASTLLALVLL